MSSYYGDRSRDVPSWESFEAGDDDDVLDTSEYQHASRDHILFCIDASASMHKPRRDTANADGRVRGKSPLHQVLESVVTFEKGKVITGPSDSVGLMVWNVDAKKAKGTGNYKPGTLVFQNLRMINAEEIKKVIKLLEEAEEQYASAQEEDDGEKTVEPQVLRDAFPPCKEADELNIADVLVTCNFLFRDAGSKLAGNKRIFLVTDNDEPPGSDTNRAPARTVYGDLMTYGITINTFFIDRPGHRFDPTDFWNDILSREEDDGKPSDDAEAAGEDGLDALAEIMDDLVIRHAPKRTQFSIPLKMGGKDGDIIIGVSGYSVISEQGKGQPKYVRLRGQTVEEIVTKTEYTSAETGAVLRPEEIGQAFQFGNESAVPNVLERNWWEADEAAEEQRAIADEALRLDEEHRAKVEAGEEDEGEGEEDDAMDGGDEAGDGAGKGKAGVKGEGGEAGVGARSAPQGRIVARTRLEFKPEEVRALRTLGMPPQIKILGFQPGEGLRYDENIKHSYFIYPDEDAFTGSTRTFAALHKTLIKLDKHALCVCRFRKNTGPEFAILIPQPETFTKDGGQDQPPGFHVILLPFADDIRKPPKNITENITATDKQVQLMATIVKRLRFKEGRYRSEAYPNPALAYHYAQLQSLAFEEDFDPVEQAEALDRTLPKHAGMHRAAGDFMREWNEEVEGDERGVRVSKAGAKRAVVELDESDLVDVEGAWRKGSLDKLKVNELKDYAKFKQISLTGKTKKADIVEVLDEWLGANAKGGKKGKGKGGADEEDVGASKKAKRGK